MKKLVLLLLAISTLIPISIGFTVDLFFGFVSAMAMCIFSGLTLSYNLNGIKKHG